MNIGNILNRRLGLVTIPNLQRVVNNLLETIGFVNDALPDSRPYKAYSALISQTGTSAPTAVVLENTLGGTPVFSYVGSGEYRLTLTGAFPQLKYFSPFPVSFYNSTPGDGVVTYYWFRENDNSVLITCLEGDSELNNAPIGFIVYN